MVCLKLHCFCRHLWQFPSKVSSLNFLDKANLSDDIKCVLFHSIFGLLHFFIADEKLWEIIEIPRF